MGIMYRIDLSNVPPSERESCRRKAERSAFDVYEIFGETDKFEILWDRQEDISTLNLPKTCIIKEV